jgi:hypothetical protein
VSYRGVEYEGIHTSKAGAEARVAEAPPDARIGVNRCEMLTTNIAGGKMYLPYVSYIPRVRTGAIKEAVL